MLKRVLIGLVLLGGFASAGFGAGFVSGFDEQSEAHRLVAKVLRKIDEIQGKPLPEERAVAVVETTFIRFEGDLYPLPDTDYISGGALTTWGEDLLLVTRGGRILRFTEDGGFAETGISAPDNGLSDYTEVAAAPEWSSYLHKPNTIRFNDIHFVERDDFRGFLLSYSFFDRDRMCGGSRLARIDVDPGVDSAEDLVVEPSDWRVIFETTPCLELDPEWTAFDGIMAGGRFDVHPDGRVIFGSGEYHRDGIHTKDLGIQDPETSYGKVLAIDYTTGEAEILAMGHRNLQGVAVDDAGEIWAVEHGVRGGDELNLIEPGENHGWPIESMGTLYSGQPLPLPGTVGRHDAFDPPAFAWLPSAAVSALTSISDFHPAWDGGLLAGSLSNSEFGRSLFHIRTEGERVIFVERISLQRRVRYVTQWGDKLALWLDPTDLLILTPVERKNPLGFALAQLDAEFSPEVARQAGNILQKCSECHSFEEGNHASAPSLNGVIGRNAGGTEYANYSDALSSLGLAWTESNLKQYLVDAETIAPGTSMPGQALSPGPVLDAVVWGLREADTTDDRHIRY